MRVRRTRRKTSSPACDASRRKRAKRRAAHDVSGGPLARLHRMRRLPGRARRGAGGRTASSDARQGLWAPRRDNAEVGGRPIVCARRACGSGALSRGAASRRMGCGSTSDRTAERSRRSDGELGRGVQPSERQRSCRVRPPIGALASISRTWIHIPSPWIHIPSPWDHPIPSEPFMLGSTGCAPSRLPDATGRASDSRALCPESPRAGQG